MKALSIAGALVVALAFGATMAVAQTGPRLGDGSNSVTPQYQYNVGGGAANIGDGSDPNFLKNQQQLQSEPGYSIGTGSAAKSAAAAYNQNSTGQNTSR